jgi:hypothetical protein
VLPNIEYGALIAGTASSITALAIITAWSEDGIYSLQGHPGLSVALVAAPTVIVISLLERLILSPPKLIKILNNWCCAE